MSIRLGSGGSGGSSARATEVVKYPEDYGASRNGVSDDTAAINACITAAIAAGVADGSHTSTIQFSAGTYLVSSATSTAHDGNAQIPLPVIDRTTAQKSTLILRGPDSAQANPIWSQTALQASGAVIRSTLTGQPFDGTDGCPSIIGGPTPEQGYSGLNFSNMLVVIDGLTVIAPLDPTVHGVDLSGVAMADIRSLNARTHGVSGTFTLPNAGFWGGTSKFACGLVMPGIGNNLLSRIGVYNAYNWLGGLAVGEHTVADVVKAIYCRVGLGMFANAPNGVRIAALSTELCRTHIYIDPIVVGGGHKCQLDIDHWEIEDGPGGIGGAGTFDTASHLTDLGNMLRGDLRFMNSITGAIALNGSAPGALKARCLDILRVPGTVTAPAVPASTVALLNPFWRDGAVSIAGGTVTAVTVDGVATGLTAGMVLVPSGKTISLTYSVAPTWSWILL